MKIKNGKLKEEKHREKTEKELEKTKHPLVIENVKIILSLADSFADRHTHSLNYTPRPVTDSDAISIYRLFLKSQWHGCT